MVIHSGININDLIDETPTRFRVRGSIYNDPAIFELELEKIFYRTWLYVGHETEIPEPGDYKTTFLGRLPVVMVRHADDSRVYVMYNRCRHRGTTVCQYEYGNASFFRCAYHGWMYTSKGELTGMPIPELYGEGFVKEELGLEHLPRVDSYRGFVFASVSPSGPTLLEHLGNARPLIDKFIEQWPEGELQLKSGIQKYGYDGNWKLQLENTIDSYHFPILHVSMLEIAKRQPNSPFANQPQRQAGRKVWDLGNGHASFEVGLGDVHFVVFPNLALLGFQVRVVRPIAAERTEIDLHMTTLKDAPEDVNETRLRRHEEGFGPASFIGPDDQEVAFTRLPIGLHANRGTDWVLMERGMAQDEALPDGRRSNPVSGEVTWRGIIREWRRALTAD